MVRAGDLCCTTSVNFWKLRAVHLNADPRLNAAVTRTHKCKWKVMRYKAKPCVSQTEIPNNRMQTESASQVESGSMGAANILPVNWKPCWLVLAEQKAWYGLEFCSPLQVAWVFTPTFWGFSDTQSSSNIWTVQCHTCRVYKAMHVCNLTSLTSWDTDRQLTTVQLTTPLPCACQPAKRDAFSDQHTDIKNRGNRERWR